MNASYPLVSARADHRCEYCLAPEAIFNLAFEVEHVVPTSQGGTDDFSNLALACRSCNLFKSDRIGASDEVVGDYVLLYHPRSDRWDDHFSLDARRRWLSLGLIP